MDDVKNLWIGAAGSLLAMFLVWLCNHGSRRVALRARVKAQAHEEWKRQAASGIKGDGFSALFHLHRALHCRMQSLGWLIACGFCVTLAVLCMRWPWLAGAFLLLLQYCTFRATYLAFKAGAMVEVAEEAAKPSVEQTETDAVSKEAP